MLPAVPPLVTSTRGPPRRPPVTRPRQAALHRWSCRSSFPVVVPVAVVPVEHPPKKILLFWSDTSPARSSARPWTLSDRLASPTRSIHLALGAEPDACACPGRTKATAARARTVRCSPGSDLCEVELPNTLRCTGHAHATTPRYRPHAGNGPLRPSAAPGEDYAAPQTSQTPAACRCRAQIAAGSGPFARRPAHPWREPGGSAVLPRRPASRPLPDLRRMYSAAGSGPTVPGSRHHRVPCRTVFRTEASCPFRRSPSTVTTEENGH
jgi:hypothetical protein